MSSYTLWIEAEEWPAGEWNPQNDNTDVMVTFDDGSRWVATFFTYSNIAKLAEKNRETGECLHGKYFWASDMILVDEVSRARIEVVVADLLACGEFRSAFCACANEDSTAQQISEGVKRPTSAAPDQFPRR